jgi:hypothetical protein
MAKRKTSGKRKRTQVPLSKRIRILHYGQHLTRKQIAKRIGIPVARVKRKLTPPRTPPKPLSRVERLEKENARLRQKVRQAREETRKAKTKKPRRAKRPEPRSARERRLFRRIREVERMGLLDRYAAEIAKALGLTLREIYSIAFSPENF